MTNLHESYRIGRPSSVSLTRQLQISVTLSYVSILFPYPTTCSFPVTQWGSFPLLQILHLASAQNLSPFCIVLVTAQQVWKRSMNKISNMYIRLQQPWFCVCWIQLLVSHSYAIWYVLYQDRGCCCCSCSSTVSPSDRRILSILWPKKRPIFIDARIREGNSVWVWGCFWVTMETRAGLAELFRLRVSLITLI